MNGYISIFVSYFISCYFFCGAQIDICKTIKSPSIVECYGSLIEKRHAFVILEYADKTLRTVLRYASIEFLQLQKWAKQLLSGLQCLHDAGRSPFFHILIAERGDRPARKGDCVGPQSE